jgi:hypothetical protein
MFFYDEWKIKYLFEIPVLNSKAIKRSKGNRTLGGIPSF